MNLDTFFEKFDLFADAPNAVAKMRELILDLAVRGKLVSQDPNDKSANTLLLAVANGDGGDSTLSKTDDGDEKPFELPVGWVWAKFSQLGELGRGKSKHRPRNDPSLYNNGKYPLVQTGDVARSNGKISTHTGLYNENGLAQSKMWPKGTLCITIAANIADSGILEFDACFPDSVVGFIPSNNNLQVQYFEYFMRTAKSQLEKFAPATAQKNINLGILEEVSIPLPPAPEQKRIVAKVDELMALCDRLEAQQQQREIRHTALAQASLTRFADAPTPANLEFLFHKSYAIDPGELRKSILTLAVQGKIVSQDANDEAVENMLLRILDEQRFLKRTIASNIRILAADGRLEYETPESWKWVTLEDISIFGPTNGISPKSVEYETPVRSLTLSATTSGRFKAEHCKYIPMELSTDSDLWLKDGDVLVQRGNTMDYVGVAAVYHGAPHQFVYPDLMMKIRVSSEVDVDFIHLAMSSEPSRSFLRARASGTSGSMPKINQATLKSLPLPIPPLAEQKRIVAKVEQLMGLVDRLEAQLAESRAKATALLDAVVAELSAVA